jgi:acetyl-CoA acetyltransferase
MAQKPIISGVYDTGAGEFRGSTCMSLHAQAALGALDDAGLTPKDIDGVLCGYSITEPHLMLSSVFCDYLGLTPAFNSSVQVGGTTACTMVIQAAALVSAGVCKHVLCVTGDNRLTGMAKGKAVAVLSELGHAQFEQPYGITLPAGYGLVMQRYMHEYKVSANAFAALAVTMRAHAMNHPGAHKRTPITIADVRMSRMISSPLHLLDCCLISDGAAAIIISAPECARDLKKRPARILGLGQGQTHEYIVTAPSLTDFGCKESSRRAFGEAGVKPKDIDVAEIYDSFTITLMVELESIGFYEKGAAGDAAIAGDFALGGKLPLNTHGGLLSYGHSGPAGGMFHIVEAVRQLRGEADVRQVPDAELAYVHGDGGILSLHASMILAKD